MATKTKKSSKTKAAKPEVEEVDDDELEELEEDDATDAAPAKKGGDDIFGVADVAKLASKGREKPITPRDLRTLLRKMARDGRLDRKIVAGNKARWSWSGPDDPEVKAILKALKGGELEAGKKEALDKLKAQKAEKNKAKQAEAKKGAKKAAVVEDDDEDDEDDE